MKCRIIRIEDYYIGQVLAPVISHDGDKETITGTAWQDIYKGEHYANVVSARVAIQIYVKDVVRKPLIIEEFEL